MLVTTMPRSLAAWMSTTLKPVPYCQARKEQIIERKNYWKMNRGVITISESGTVSMPTDTVWMTMHHLSKGITADMDTKEPGLAYPSSKPSWIAMDLPVR